MLQLILDVLNKPYLLYVANHIQEKEHMHGNYCAFQYQCHCPTSLLTHVVIREFVT